MLFTCGSSFHLTPSAQQRFTHKLADTLAQYPTSFETGENLYFISGAEMFAHMLSLFVIKPNPCGSPNQVAVFVRFILWGLEKNREYNSMLAYERMVGKYAGWRDVDDRIVQTHTWGWIKVIDRPWHALTQRSRLNPDQWLIYLFAFECVCF